MLFDCGFAGTVSLVLVIIVAVGVWRILRSLLRWLRERRQPQRQLQGALCSFPTLNILLFKSPGRFEVSKKKATSRIREVAKIFGSVKWQDTNIYPFIERLLS